LKGLVDKPVLAGNQVGRTEK